MKLLFSLLLLPLYPFLKLLQKALMRYGANDKVRLIEEVVVITRKGGKKHVIT